MRPNATRASGPEQVAEQRNRILAVTTELIADFGYEALRLRDIADTAGVSIGLLQHYFDSREKLLGAAFAHHCDSTLAALQATQHSASDPWQRLLATVRSLTSQPDPQRSARTWIEFVTATARHAALRPGLTEVYAAWRALLREAISQGRRAGQFTPMVTVGDAADILMTSIDGCLLALASDTDVIDVARFEKLFAQQAAGLLGVTLHRGRPAT